eukprot:9387791-Ditylum_brightwellii.AAC.1
MKELFKGLTSSWNIHMITHSTLLILIGIIVQICDILKDSKIKINLEHIKGHQDDNTPYEELNLPACLNTEVGKQSPESPTGNPGHNKEPSNIT